MPVSDLRDDDVVGIVCCCDNALNVSVQEATPDALRFRIPGGAGAATRRDSAIDEIVHFVEMMAVIKAMNVVLLVNHEGCGDFAAHHGELEGDASHDAHRCELDEVKGKLSQVFPQIRFETLLTDLHGRTLREEAAANATRATSFRLCGSALFALA